MQNELKRQLNAWLLLLVFVPTMAAATLHIHNDYNDAETTCLDCANHHAHAGHLSNDSGHLHDCILCQLLQGSFLVASIVIFQHLFFHHRTAIACPDKAICGYKGDGLSTRAPPEW